MRAESPFGVNLPPSPALTFVHSPLYPQLCLGAGVELLPALQWLCSLCSHTHTGAAVTVPRAQHSPLEFPCSQTQFRQGTHQSGAAARAGEPTCPAPPACNTRSRRWREGPAPRGCWKGAELLWPLEYNHTGSGKPEHHSNLLLLCLNKKNAEAGYWSNAQIK